MKPAVIAVSLVAALGIGVVAGVIGHASMAGTTQASTRIDAPRAPAEEPIAQPLRADSNEATLPVVHPEIVPARQSVDEVVFADDGVFDDETRRHGEAGLREGWASVRDDDMPAGAIATGIAQYEDAVTTLPRSIGRRLAELTTRREAAESRGRAVAVLEQIRQTNEPLPELVEDAKRFDELFERSLPESTRDGPTALKSERGSLADGSTLLFGPGLHDISFGLFRNEPPRDITMAGSGMDLTMLRHDEFISGHAPLVGLTLRDCTLVHDGCLFDVRTDDSVITLERVRVVGFDCGAGGSSAINLRAAALRVRDCRFEGGYGRSPEHAQLLDIRVPAVVARFERCRFSRLAVADYGFQSSWSVFFVGCTFSETFDHRPLEEKLRGHAGVGFSGCSFSELPAQEARALPPPVELDRLFPGWRTKQR